jgi:polyferredoxin
MKTKKKTIRNTGKPVQKYRFTIQLIFALLCIWIGIDFYRFVHFLETNGAAKFFNRPPGVDGFLPISSMMSLYLFLSTGEIHFAHPAGLFIFISILLMSFVFGKSFCSWLCPVGFISELIGDFGEKIFGKKLILPRWIDTPLRSLKYILLAFLLYSVFFLMGINAVKAFLDSPYNQVADLKMYYFFAEISRFSLIVLGSLFLLSIFIRNFWCRFLCPYGALLGIISLFSPNKIKRNPVNCIDCGLCTKACPSAIKVDKVITVYSDECTSCLNCVDACPVADTLEIKPVLLKKKLPKKYVAFGVILIFLSVTGSGMITGHWQNRISKEQYLVHYKLMDTYGHPMGPAEVKEFDKESRMENSRENLNKTKKFPLQLIKN